MQRKLHKRKKAELDIDLIWDHIAKDSVRSADVVLKRIGDIFQLLLDMPLAGSDRSDLKPGLRSFVVGNNYIVFYYVVPDGVEIVRVLHARQGIDAYDLG